MSGVSQAGGFLRSQDGKTCSWGQRVSLQQKEAASLAVRMEGRKKLVLGVKLTSHLVALIFLAKYELRFLLESNTRERRWWGVPGATLKSEMIKENQVRHSSQFRHPIKGF